MKQVGTNINRVGILSTLVDVTLQQKEIGKDGDVINVRILGEVTQVNDCPSSVLESMGTQLIKMVKEKGCENLVDSL